MSLSNLYDVKHATEAIITLVSLSSSEMNAYRERKMEKRRLDLERFANAASHLPSIVAAACQRCNVDAKAIEKDESAWRDYLKGVGGKPSKAFLSSVEAVRREVEERVREAERDYSSYEAYTSDEEESEDSSE